MLKSRERAVSPETMIVDIQNNMRYESLGNTGLLVSRLCLGTMTFGDGQGPFKAIGALGQKEADALVKAAIEAELISSIQPMSTPRALARKRSGNRSAI